MSRRRDPRGVPQVMSPAPEPDLPRDTPRSHLAAGLLVCGLLGCFAWLVADTWFLCDDAFISFRYARNLLAGHGLVFNPGERVEGFTNLLWTLELAAALRCGLRPEVAAHVLSLACTVGVFALVGALAWRSGRRRGTPWILPLAVGLLAGSTSFAAWSTSGLETRQFTFLVLAGMAALLGRDPAWYRRFGASLSFAAAALTRPEGLLLFGCAGLWRLLVDVRTGRPYLARGIVLLLPFVVVVVAQFAWRHSFYGEWLPNTYYAKHVRAWPESGAIYFTAAALALGAWLWLPLAAIAAVARAARRDPSWLLPFAMVVPHLLYLLQIGGDHFEWRPLDVELALLAVPAAEGAWLVGRGVLGAWPRRWPRTATAAAALATLLLSTFVHAVGLTTRLASRTLTEREQTWRLRQVLDADRAAPAAWLPGGPTLIALWNEQQARLPEAVAAPLQEHIVWGRVQRQRFERYGEFAGVLPDGLVMPCGAAGIAPFYLPDVEIVDTLGLTDAAIARHDRDVPNAARAMAHDRVPPPGYLQQRGCNLEIRAWAASETEALRSAGFALRLAPDVWMPIVAGDVPFVQRAFDPQRLAWRWWTDDGDAARNRIRFGGREYAGERLLATFETTAGQLAWQCSGSAQVTEGRRLPVPPNEVPRGGACGGMVLTTWSGEPDVAGAARSQPFPARAGDRLVLFCRGRGGLGLWARLFADGRAVRSVLPPGGLGDDFVPVVVPLDPFAGAALTLEVHDDGPGWVALDHVLLAREVAGTSPTESDAWTPGPRLSGVPGLLSLEALTSQEGHARSGATTLTLTNPFAPARFEVELAEGPAPATLWRGEWLVAGAPTEVIGTGVTASLRLWLDVPEGTPCDLEPYVVRLSILDVARPTEPVRRVELVVPFQP